MVYLVLWSNAVCSPRLRTTETGGSIASGVVPHFFGKFTRGSGAGRADEHSRPGIGHGAPSGPKRAKAPADDLSSVIIDTQGPDSRSRRMADVAEAADPFGVSERLNRIRSAPG
jgi:hypothetical protein